eukprot:2636869-Lingulodinium_polyedra.AAC.1
MDEVKWRENVTGVKGAPHDFLAPWPHEGEQSPTVSRGRYAYNILVPGLAPQGPAAAPAREPPAGTPGTPQ